MKAPRIHNRVFFFFRSIEIISNFYLELDEPIKYRDKGGGGEMRIWRIPNLGED